MIPLSGISSLSFIQWCLDHLNYWTVGLLMTIESSFIPFPSEIVVPPAAYNAAAGELNIYLVLLASCIGAMLGALINYGLAYWLGRPLIYRFINSKVGRMCLLTEEKMQRAETYFVAKGNISTFIGRLIPVIRQLISLPAGFSKMPLGAFLLYTFLGAGIWNGILAVIGYSLHAVVPKNQLMERVSHYANPISYAFLSIAGLIIGILVFRRYRHRRQTKEQTQEGLR